ncbi:hypothetical protein MAJ_08879, partial [Metarhizium majus ARSEF 297]
MSCYQDAQPMLTRSGSRKKRVLPASFSDKACSSQKRQLSGIEEQFKRPPPSLPSPPCSADRKSQITSIDERNGVDKAVTLAPPANEVPLSVNRTDRERDPARIRGKLAKYPPLQVRWKERQFTADVNPLIHELRMLIRNRNIGCGLCAWYEWGPIVGTHKLKYCKHRGEACEARRWLDMFRGYQAEGGGTGARCQHCRFPVTLCWRTVYREEMDAEYGNEVEAREQFDEWYHEVRCDWVKTIQRFVASRMVAGGILGGRGVSEIGVTALEGMGWKNWRGLEEKGPKCVQKWLEEADEIDGLRCPRLLKLFWKLAKHNAGR